MQNSRLPIELCELVIDLTPNTWPRQWYGQIDLWSLRRIVSCTVVCSAWLPRARTVLYHTVVFKSTTQVDCFTRTMTENPWFSDMVHELVIYPSSSTPYVPYIHAILSTRFPHLRIRTLEFYLHDVKKWLYPPHHHLQLAMLPITTLVITGIPETRWMDIFRLIWSLRGLQSLHLDGHRLGVDSAISFSDSELQRLENMRRSWTCAALTTLVISNLRILTLPRQAFGTSVQRFYHTYTDPSFIMKAELPLFSSLQELYIGFWSENGPKDLNSSTIVSRNIAPILTHLPETHSLQAITFEIYIAAYQRREEFLHDLSSHKVDDLLNKFPKLGSLHIMIPENSLDLSIPDVNWWKDQLRAHLPRLRQDVCLTVDIQMSSWIVWDDHLEPPASLEDVDWEDVTPEEKSDLFEESGLTTEHHDHRIRSISNRLGHAFTFLRPRRSLTSTNSQSQSQSPAQPSLSRRVRRSVRKITGRVRGKLVQHD